MVLIDSLFSVAEPKRRRVLPPANTSTDFHFDDDLDDPIPFTSPSPLKPLSYAKRKKTEEESNSAIWVKPKAPGETTIYSRHIFGFSIALSFAVEIPSVASGDYCKGDDSSPLCECLFVECAMSNTCFL